MKSVNEKTLISIPVVAMILTVVVWITRLGSQVDQSEKEIRELRQRIERLERNEKH